MVTTSSGASQRRPYRKRTMYDVERYDVGEFPRCIRTERIEDLHWMDCFSARVRRSDWFLVPCFRLIYKPITMYMAYA